MKVTALTLKPGNVIDYNGKLFVILKSEAIQPGKGNAVVQVEMRDVFSGNKVDERFRTQETVEKAFVDEMEFQYLYDEGNNATFMNNETYEQLSVDKDLIGDPAVYLQEGMMVSISLHDGKPLSVTLPKHVTMEVIEAEPVVKGQTASSSYKPAVVENGQRVMVPPHIATGTRIVINTMDNSYVERAKD